MCSSLSHFISYYSAKHPFCPRYAFLPKSILPLLHSLPRLLLFVPHRLYVRIPCINNHVFVPYNDLLLESIWATRITCWIDHTTKPTNDEMGNGWRRRKSESHHGEHCITSWDTDRIFTNSTKHATYFAATTNTACIEFGWSKVEFHSAYCTIVFYNWFHSKLRAAKYSASSLFRSNEIICCRCIHIIAIHSIACIYSVIFILSWCGSDLAEFNLSRWI